MNRIIRIWIVLFFAVLLLVSCSDLLLQLGEQGDAQIGIDGEPSFSLQIQTIPEYDTDTYTLQVQRGAIVSFSAVVEPIDENASLSYRWFLDGEDLQEPLQANILELDTAMVPIGTSEVTAVAHQVDNNLIRDSVISLVIVE